MAEEREQRRSPRIVTESLPGRMAFSLEAEILNVSRGGLAIRTAHQLRIGNRYQVQIGEKEHSVETTGTVKRCRLKGTRQAGEGGDFEPVYEAGIEFEHPLSEQKHKLLSVMARSVSIKLAPRLFGRFLVPPERAATLKSDVEFEVKKISLTGLLTEAEGPPCPLDSIDLEINLDGESFTCAGRIVNSRIIQDGDEQQQRTQYGVEFVDTEPRHVERLESFVLGALARDF